MPTSIRVLLADDDPDFLAEVADLLRYQTKLDYRFEIVASAVNGREAVDLARQHHPEIALLDLEMPGLDGMAAARLMRQQAEPPAVMILSSHYNRLDFQAALAGDIRGFVIKSHIAQLFIALEEVYNNGVWFDSLVLHQMYSQALKKQDRISWRQPLTPREKEILGLFSRGRSQAAIAGELKMGIETVKTHLANIRNKAECANLNELRLKISS